MSLLLNRRQCEMLAEMGVRAYLPQCRNRRLAPESASQPDCNAALAGKGLAKGASNAAAEQANALPSAPAPLAAPPALQSLSLENFWRVSTANSPLLYRKARQK